MNTHDAARGTNGVDEARNACVTSSALVGKDKFEVELVLLHAGPSAKRTAARLLEAAPPPRRPGVAACSFAVDKGVDGRENEQGQEGRAHEAADDHGSERPLHLHARAGRQRHGDEAERRDGHVITTAAAETQLLLAQLERRLALLVAS